MSDVTSDALDNNDNGGTHERETYDRAAQIIAQSLAQGLMEAQVIIAAERDARAPSVAPELIDTLDRFGGVLGKLIEVNEQISERMVELTDAVTSLVESSRVPQTAAPSVAPPAAAKPQLPEMEAAFSPGGEGIDVTIAAVPGFQGLMELQRALVRLSQVQSAAVRRYQDDEASIQLTLTEPMTPSAIAEGVSASTGRGIVVDEARPDALRLRLRFI